MTNYIQSDRKKNLITLTFNQNEDDTYFYVFYPDFWRFDRRKIVERINFVNIL